MNIHDLVVKAIESDDIYKRRYTRSIIFKYQKLSEEEKFQFDLIFIDLTGYPLSYFIKEVTNETSNNN